MINRTLLKYDGRAHWGLFLFIQLVLLLYGSISVWMFDPESADALINMIGVLPEGMVRAMGFDKLGTDLTEYVASYLYGFIMIIFPIIYCAILSSSLVARHVERGSMVYLLTTPNSRVSIALTQALYLLASTAVLTILLTGSVILMSAALHPGMLDLGRFLRLNAVTGSVLTAAAAIGFLGSCLFTETRWALAVGAGVPGAMFVLKMISELSDRLAWLGYLSVFTLIDQDRIFSAGRFCLTAIGGSLAGAVLLVWIGTRVFDRRSLAI